MGLFDFLCKRDAKTSDTTPSPRVNVGPVGIHTVADYLHYVGNMLDVNLKDKRNYRGRLVDLSDDGRSLILSDVTEYTLTERHDEETVARRSRILVPVAEINIVEVRDRGR